MLLLKARDIPTLSRGWLLVSLRPTGSPPWRHPRPMGWNWERMRPTPAAAAPLLRPWQSLLPLRVAPYTLQLWLITLVNLTMCRHQCIFCARYVNFSRFLSLVCSKTYFWGWQLWECPRWAFKGPASFFLRRPILKPPRVLNNWDARYMI